MSKCRVLILREAARARRICKETNLTTGAKVSWQSTPSFELSESMNHQPSEERCRQRPSSWGKLFGQAEDQRDPKCDCRVIWQSQSPQRRANDQHAGA